MAESEFKFFANLNRSKQPGKTGQYWSRSLFPVDELRKLFEWVKTAEKQQDFKGNEAVEISINLLPKESKAGNQYLLMVMSPPLPPEQRPSSADPDASPF